MGSVIEDFSEHLDDFLCADGTMCILRGQVCDGRSHCHDGSDEKGCRDSLGKKQSCLHSCFLFLHRKPLHARAVFVFLISNFGGFFFFSFLNS